ncbi:MAG: hypothetical protein K2Q23_17685 [Bryobacteraceae bacterium]|nr:hypothetical protein [Bryobacteraceae bacterium]
MVGRQREAPKRTPILEREDHAVGDEVEMALAREASGEIGPRHASPGLEARAREGGWKGVVRQETSAFDHGRKVIDARRWIAGRGRRKFRHLDRLPFDDLLRSRSRRDQTIGQPSELVDG